MSNTAYQILSRLYTSNKFPWIIICIGVALRIIRYFHNPSFGHDESDISIDVISRPLSDLINPSSDYSQTHPLGFLMLIKLSSQILGNSEYALRLLPLLFGIISLFLFYKVATYFIQPKAIPVALGLFAISDPLIYEASNLKPYGSDVTFALLILYMTIYFHSKKLNIFNAIVFGILGAITIWFSHPSVFVLAGVGLTLTVFSLIRKEWSRIGILLITYLIWLLSFLVYYFIYTRNLMTSIEVNFGIDTLLKMEKSLMPFPPKSMKDIKWYIDSFFKIFDYPVGLYLTGIATLTFLVGCRSLFWEKKEKLFILISPIAFNLLATALQQYPFSGRLLFYLVPSILFLIATGTEEIRVKTKNASVIIGILLVGVLFLHPLATASYRIVKPLAFEDMRPVMNYIKNNWKNGDLLYVHYFAQYEFLYYSKYHSEPLDFKESNYIIGIGPRGWYTKWRKQEVSKYYNPEETITQSSFEIFKTYEKDLNQLKGHKRVWILFAAVIPKDGIEEEKFFLYHLNNIGKQLNFYGRPRVSTTYLYDLSEEASRHVE